MLAKDDLFITCKYQQVGSQLLQCAPRCQLERGERHKERPLGYSAGSVVPYIVDIILSLEAWDEALIKAAPLIGHIDHLDKLTPVEQADVLRTVMKTALGRHHQWLADRGIGAVISPVETNERGFSFKFTYGPDALLFLHEFDGLLRAETDQITH
jgi:hypothetical protein